ncbi:sugar fermentation stimulation protein A [Sporobacter termitidis DSM 10068]|uniref:Sugar fermentation stimulation protein homolog n=1 Tax=Sporobacter termitidis DSM 10068 TaxID=1123282 RepID=A0A1M5VDD4_9FIRM|nr:DNA/RNA nuclease SfsA [Sporobacter termitidis]SHH73237.1 sugar fermentation stimulation protein A [Sporobacter termitidis DSM 10068]
MIYENIRRAVFLDRPNRFIANIEIDGGSEVCHVKNTGRCRELLIPGTAVFVQDFGGPLGLPRARKTKYDLIAVQKGERLINMDSAAPNKVFAEWVRAGGLFREVTLLRPEYRYGSSRFDFYIEAGGRRALVEVKGVTLEEDGATRFPDAPTERGVKHLRELVSAAAAGYDAYAVFVIQMKGVRYMEPNWATHEAFGSALRDAYQAGVNVLAVDCFVTENSITAAEPVEVRLGRGVTRNH